ncbi:hypothetical protein G6F40_015782 [Rhizopus arrhizus]|nr:hypothetical protein G6F40_015782 [Rhizopus arrhizus]
MPAVRSESPPRQSSSTLPFCTTCNAPDSASRARSASSFAAASAIRTGKATRAGLYLSGVSAPSIWNCFTCAGLAGSMTAVTRIARSFNWPITNSFAWLDVLSSVSRTLSGPVLSRKSR